MPREHCLLAHGGGTKLLCVRRALRILLHHLYLWVNQTPEVCLVAQDVVEVLVGAPARRRRRTRAHLRGSGVSF